MFSNDFIKELQKIQKESIGDDGYKFIKLFETKFIQEKKIYKTNCDKSNSYYFDMIFSEFSQDNPEIINYIYYKKHIRDIIKKFEEYGFRYVRTIDGVNSHMTFNIKENYHYDNITKIKTIRFFFTY